MDRIDTFQKIKMLRDAIQCNNKNNFTHLQNRKLQQDLEEAKANISEHLQNAQKMEKDHESLVNRLKSDFEEKIGQMLTERDEISTKFHSENKIVELEEEILLEKEKARTAMELARIEIKAVEQRFKVVLDEKDAQMQKSRSIAQQNEDLQVILQ